MCYRGAGIVALLVALLSGSLQAQLYNDDQLDSLRSAARSKDSLGMDALTKLCTHFGSVNNDSSWRYAEQLAIQAGQIDDHYFLGMANHHKGVCRGNEGNNRAGVKYHKKAIYYFGKINRRDKQARQYMNLGNRYADMTMLDTAGYYYELGGRMAKEAGDLEAYAGSILNAASIHFHVGRYDKYYGLSMKAYKIFKEQNNHSNVALVLSNLSSYYMMHKKFRKSRKACLEAMELYKTLGDNNGVVQQYERLGQMQFMQKNLDSTAYYFAKAFALLQETNDLNLRAQMQENYGIMLANSGNQETAEKLYVQAYDFWKQSGNKHRMAANLQLQGVNAWKKGEFQKSIDFIEQAIDIAVEAGMAKEAMEWYGKLGVAYSDIGDYKRAYEYKNIFIRMNDSLSQLQNEQLLAEADARFQSEKKEQQIEIQQKELEKQEAENKVQSYFNVGLGVGVLLLISLAVVVFRAYGQKKKDNQFIQHQKVLVEEKNREITDSITYAQRIQEAILPSESKFEQAFKDHFLLYLPKDIVAGDFFWLEQTQDQLLFAVADCTGHGVPGAMVSVVCNNALNRSVREFGLTQPGAVLDKTRELVKEAFRKEGMSVNDGMDIALCALNPREGVLEFAGANNPLWVVSAEGDVKVVNGDKQPVGNHHKENNFTTSSIDLTEGDTLYLFSDGFVDQFGGPKGKKFKSAPFRQLLTGISNQSMTDQCSAIGKAFNRWKGDLEQIDDVCVLGVRV